MLPDTFVTELEKISGYLTKDEERKRDLQHTAIGVAGMPVASGASNLFQHGRIVPKGIKPGRWLAGNAVGGAILGAALPYARNLVTDRINDQATERRRGA